MAETYLESKIRTRIKDEGRITFAEFMDSALYDPDGGYYSRPDRISESGDFFTSPSAHPAFGALVCTQLYEMWQILESPAEFAVVEYGAGNGVLADDIKAHASRVDPDFGRAIVYTGLDRGTAESGNVRKGPRGAIGCVISNELLDAFPAHRFLVSGGTLKELWVVERDGVLAEEPGELSDPAIAERLEKACPGLPDGYTSEINMGLDPWASSVAGNIRTGFVLTIDYGYPAGQLYAPERATGTLQCYYRHTLNANPFLHVGRQDLTVHVDFTAVDEALSRVEFTQLGFTTQTKFLARLGAEDFKLDLDGLDIPRRAVAANRMAMDQILRPDGLGAFKVAIHSKGVDSPRLAGLLDGTDGRTSDVPAPPLPLLDDDPRRVRLFEGSYPYATEFTGTWDELLGGVPDEVDETE